MSAQRTRFVEFERGEIDLETGEFPMILATDGEASDGDILSIEGAQFTSRAPLQISHVNDPRDTLGTVSGFRRDLQSSPKRLKARGQIELTGEGPTAEIRRDIAHMIQQGHVSGVSVRWEPMKFTRRASLPKEHYAHVKEDEPDMRKRHGYFHDRWRVLEGSIVAIQADKAAMIGRAEETEGVVSDFWRALASTAQEREEIEAPTPLEGDAAAEAIRERLAALPAPVWVSPVTPQVDNAGRLAALGAHIRELREQHGVNLELIEEIIEAQRPPAEPTLAEALDTISSLRTRVEALEAGRANGSPPEPLNPTVFLQALKRETEELVARTDVGIKAYLEQERGRILEDEELRAAAAHIKARVQELRLRK